jgi:hypothetical protein
MTPIELRVAFRCETGIYPLWAKDHRGDSVKDPHINVGLSAGRTTIKGMPSSEYGRWLEEKSGLSARVLRDRYYQQTKEWPTRNYFGYRNRYEEDYLRADYSFWLESQFAGENTLYEQNKY